MIKNRYHNLSSYNAELLGVHDKKIQRELWDNLIRLADNTRVIFEANQIDYNTEESMYVLYFPDGTVKAYKANMPSIDTLISDICS